MRCIPNQSGSATAGADVCLARQKTWEHSPFLLSQECFLVFCNFQKGDDILCCGERKGLSKGKSRYRVREICTDELNAADARLNFTMDTMRNVTAKIHWYDQFQSTPILSVNRNTTMKDVPLQPKCRMPASTTLGTPLTKAVIPASIIAIP